MMTKLVINDVVHNCYLENDADADYGDIVIPVFLVVFFILL